MRKTTFLAGAATVVALVGTGTAAHATTGDQLIGGCGVQVSQVSTVAPDRYDGEIFEASLALDGSNSPTGAQVSCWIDVNGVEAPISRLNTGGFADQWGEKSLSYTATSTDVVTLCQQVTFLDGSTWTAADGNVGTDCQPI
jgi:hypothetical protein